MAIKSKTATLHASGAELASGNGAGVNCRSNIGAVYLSVTGVAGSPGLLDVTVEEQDPKSGRWYTIATFAQVAQSTTTEKVALTGFYANNLRAAWTITGPSPGYIFEVTFAGEG
jgi:hypothetical protein